MPFGGLSRRLIQSRHKRRCSGGDCIMLESIALARTGDSLLPVALAAIVIVAIVVLIVAVAKMRRR